MRFHNEAALLLSAKSEGLVRAYESGHLKDEVPYLVLERLSHSLADVLDAHASGLPEKKALAVAQALAAALARLHESGVIHRDLKPSNIMFAESSDAVGNDCALRLIDLGLAKFDPLRGSAAGATPERFLPVSTADTALLGTYEYMAPEQCLNPKQVRVPSDSYSLGVVIFQMLSGQLPFSDPCTKVLMSKHLWDKPPLGLVRSRAVRSLVAALLSKEPASRPSAAEASAHLARLLKKTS